MSKRRTNDAYYTHTAVTKALLYRIPGIRHATVFEPCAGSGLMANELRNAGCKVVTNDIADHECDYQCDATDRGEVCWEYYDWVVTNPPFNLAHKILPIALDHANVGVAFLLRLSYLEPANGRREWLQHHADQMVYCGVLNPRPRFRAGEINPKTGNEYGTDNVTVAWMVWKKNWSWLDMGIRRPFDFITDWQVGA